MIDREAEYLRRMEADRDLFRGQRDELLDIAKKVYQMLELCGYGGHNPKTERKHLDILRKIISRALD